MILENLTKKYSTHLFSFCFSILQLEYFPNLFLYPDARCLASPTSYKLPDRKDQSIKIKKAFNPLHFQCRPLVSIESLLSSCVYVLRVIISNCLLSVNTYNHKITMCSYIIMMYNLKKISPEWCCKDLQRAIWRIYYLVSGNSQYSGSRCICMCICIHMH